MTPTVDNSQRTHAVRRVLVITLVLNLMVAAAKAVYGVLSGSLVIAADAIHSIGDGGSNVVGLVILKASSEPPDERHPYGHHKLEIVAAVGISAFIAIAGARFAWSAFSALLFGRAAPHTSLAGFVIIGVTFLTNIGVATYEARRARELRSPYLAADAAHTTSDIAVTAAVLGSFAASHAGLAWADAAGTLLVVAVIARIAWKIAHENIAILIDSAAVDTAQVIRIVLAIPGVIGCHRVRSRGTASAVHLDLHVQADGAISLTAAHELAHRVEQALCEQLSELADVTIHMEPDDDGEEGL